MWILFAIASALSYTASGLLARHVMKGHKDAWAFAFSLSVVGTIVTLPAAMHSVALPTQTFIWIQMIALCVLIVAHNGLMLSAAKFLSPSLSGSLTKLRLVWAFLLGIIFLSEPFSFQRLFGTAATVLAGSLVIKKVQQTTSLHGVSLVVTATILFAFLNMLKKILLPSFGTVGLTFFNFLIPGSLILLFVPRLLHRIKILYKEDGKVVVGSSVCNAVGTLLLNQALSLGHVSSVLVVQEAFLVITFMGEYIFLKEQTHMKIKIAAVSLALLGALLMRL